MAIYHLSVKIIGRSAGRSVTAAAAYRSGTRIADDRTGLVHDFQRKGGVMHREIMLPDAAPAWMGDRVALWNAVEKAERRKDSQLAREVEIALPRELDQETRLSLVKDFVQSEFVARGMIADVAIHNPMINKQEYPHAHILLTMRNIFCDGFGDKNREWNNKETLERWREHWAERANRTLDRTGHDERIDHRSLQAQRAAALDRAADVRTSEPERAVAICEAHLLNREPEPKLGSVATALERRGILTDRGDDLRAVLARNSERMMLWEPLAPVREALAAVHARATATLTHRVVGARDVVKAVRERIIGWLSASPPSPKPAPARLGREARLVQGDQMAPSPAAPANLDALLGRQLPAGRPAPDRAELLGHRQGDGVARADLPGRDRDDRGRC